MKKLYDFSFISRANFAVEIKQLGPTKFFWKMVLTKNMSTTLGFMLKPIKVCVR